MLMKALSPSLEKILFIWSFSFAPVLLLFLCSGTWFFYGVWLRWSWESNFIAMSAATASLEVARARNESSRQHSKSILVGPRHRKRIKTLSNRCSDSQSLKSFELSTLLGSESPTNHGQDIEQINYGCPGTSHAVPLSSERYMNGVSRATIVYLLRIQETGV